MSLRHAAIFAFVLAACGDGAGAIALGDHVAVGAVVPDFAFDGVDEGGARATIHLRDYAGDGRLLVVRVQGGAWCGTCNWHAAHTREIFEEAPARVRVLDLVVGDRENAPASAEVAASWRASLDVRDHVAVGADPSFALGPLLDGALPLVVLVDTRSMTIVRAESNPDPVALADSIDLAIAARDESPAPLAREETLVDGLFHRNEWDMIRAIETPGAPPRDPSNEVADDPRAAALGKALFEDTALSPGRVACVTCHDPSRAFADDLPVAIGVGRGDRHTPRIALAAFSPTQFWDGRAGSLEAQALGPIENPVEMGSSRALVASRVAFAYAAPFSDLFPGALGDTDAVFTDVGKALAAYERTLRVAPTALDAYAGGDVTALDFPQKQGLAAFAREGCMQCHWGPRLTDDAFHVTRTPTGRADGAADVGREGHLGAFKTPSLRGVARMHHFAHGGAIGSLDDMIASYGDGRIVDRAVGTREPWIPRFGETTRWSILKLVQTLDE